MEQEQNKANELEDRAEEKRVGTVQNEEAVAAPPVDGTVTKTTQTETVEPEEGTVTRNVIETEEHENPNLGGNS